MTTSRVEQQNRRAVRRWLLPAAAIGATFLSVQARADAPYDRCLQAAAGSFAFNACGQAWLKREEAALTVAWRRTYGSMVEPETKSALLAEQRKWIAYKDAACRFLGTREYGSNGWSLERPACMARVIRARTIQLGEYEHTGGEGGQ